MVIHDMEIDVFTGFYFIRTIHIDPVDDAAKYDIEKAVVEICEDDETMIQM